MTPQEAADVVKAYYKDGAQIQLNEGDGWGDTNHPVFDGFDELDYRVKPTPRVIWVNEHTNGDMYIHDREDFSTATNTNCKVTKYQEVL